MRVRPLQPTDRDEWYRMRCALWPDHDPRELDAEMRAAETTGTICGWPTRVFVLDRGEGRLGGFLEATLRSFAHGCRTSPVGYIEGWHVDDDLRRRGFGRALVRAAEDWARAQGCREMASDCNATNVVSFAAHGKLGYSVSDKSILFRKALVDAPVSDDQRDWIALTSQGLSVATALKLVTDASAGGIAVFLGTTRAETNDRGQPLVALDYEAYPEMALEQMRDLARRARQRWPIVRLALLHCIGRVPLGEPSVIIAVACAHRGEAFDACEWLIDTLKVQVPIWKKEIWSDGTGTWVDPGGERPQS
jgi:molybdopterin synthase catalytic subunit/GNAT superfamily N-acetyltransferase